MLNNKNGLLFYGINGRAAIAFQGGTLCVKAQIKRTPSVNSGGNPPPNDCSGLFTIDMNLFAAGGIPSGTPLPELSLPGTLVNSSISVMSRSLRPSCICASTKSWLHT